MTWRHHDSSVADPFPGPSEYNASDVAKLQEVIISLRRPSRSVLYVAVITMAEFLRLPNFKGCKVSAGALLPPGAARVTHLASPAERLEDIPPKTGDMMTAEIPSRKVLDDKDKKKRKAEEKAVAHTADADIQIDKVATKRGAGREGGCKKRKVRVGAPVQQDSEHVSSLTPLNHALPLETLANTNHVSPNVSAGRMGVLRNQTDEHVPPPPLVNAGVFVTGRDGIQENVAAFVIKGHDDNEGGIFGLQTQPSPPRPAGYSASRFGNLPFTPQWGLTNSSCMDNFRQCQDMMSNLFTPADLEFFNEGLSAKQAERIEQLEEALRQSKDDAHQLRLDREKYVVEAGKGNMVRRQIINDYLPTFVCRLHQSNEYKRSLGEVFSLAIGKGFIDGISIGHKDLDILTPLLPFRCDLILGVLHIQAILKATSNVYPTSADIFIDRYEKLFDKRYPYVDKVARMYLLDPSGLQNVMPDETGPTPGGGHAILQRILMLRYQYL
ncbi:hypothetical protein Tco_0110882 [Tanacetum coccineum]